jgi:hypothetical protein
MPANEGMRFIVCYFYLAQEPFDARCLADIHHALTYRVICVHPVDHVRHLCHLCRSRCEHERQDEGESFHDSSDSFQARTAHDALLPRTLVWLPKMRLLWPAATLFLLLIVVALIYFYRDRVIGCDVMEPGGTLYLRHEAVDTVRGRFCYASDCRLIAELMSEVERASWYCY